MRRTQFAVRAALVALLSLSLAVGLGTASAKHAPHHGGHHGGKPRHGAGFDHVFIIMMENTGNDTLLGNPNAPWINWAVQRYNVAGNYYGVTHPSQPNYIASTSGSLNGVSSDNDTSLNVTNVVDQLEAKKLTWKAYMQSLNDCISGTATPTAITGETTNYKFDHACGDAHYGPQLYERKHNPFVTYQDVATNAARMANIVDFTQLQSDLKSGKVANYNWISPDQCHDMHGTAAPSTSDPCAYSQVSSLISMGDAFLKSTVHEIMTSRVWHQNSAIFITWDEADYTGSGYQGFADDSGCCDSPAAQGGGHVLTIVIPSRAGNDSSGTHDSFVPYNHYSMLSTVEHNWGLGCLGFTCDTKNVKPMTSLFGGHSKHGDR